MGWVTMVETLKTIDTNSSHVKINVDKKLFRAYEYNYILHGEIGNYV